MPCRIAVSDSNGWVVATGLADCRRSDLAALNPGRSDFAFRLLLPPVSGPASFVVSADGVVLPNSPVCMGPGLFDGTATCSDGTVSGWVTERVFDGATFHPPVIRAVDQDGRVLGETASGIEPGDDPGFAPAAFRLELPDWAFANKSLDIQLHANGTAFARCTATLHVIGYIDALTPERCAGWVLSPQVEGRCFTVTAYSGDAVLGTGACRIRRADLAERFPGAATAGFDFPLRPAAPHGLWQPVSLRFSGSTAELFGGPFLRVGRPGLVALAHRAGQGLRRAVAADGTGFADAALKGGLRRVIEQARAQDGWELLPVPARCPRRVAGIRLTIIVPVYRDVAATRDCLDSVLAHRDPGRDRLVVVDDLSPEPGMAALLGGVAAEPNVILLRNAANLGFIRSVNRGLGFCLGGDILLLNSDTRLFAGGLDEMLQVLHASPDVGTVTALSNNATIFSYPHPTLRGPALPDAPWEALAAVALAENRGVSVDVPTAHGFCMLIREEVLEQVGPLDEAFGRGYGEENDFCQRAADGGYRHVAACGVLVEHRESTSFTAEMPELLARNLRLLDQRYPEYTPTVLAFERSDPLRVGRWALDRHRLAAAAAGCLLVVESWFGGGSRKAAAELQDQLLRPGQAVLSMRAREDGFVTVASAAPAMDALFAPDEADALFALLAAARPAATIVHQMLGFTAAVLGRLSDWLGQRRSLVYLHDFYAACPRVTLIDAAGTFCGVPAAEACTRCLGLGGSHEHSRLTELSPAAHRGLFAALLARASLVVTPSEDTAHWIARAFPAIDVQVVPHRSRDAPAPSAPRAGLRTNIVLLGAIGLHKGADRLLALARQAWLARPDLRFVVVGHTACDDALATLPNVRITGVYQPDQLAALIDAANGCAALFLHGWPETFSYTLTEAAQFGLLPIVPDIGAPAARVRAAGFGIVFPFPFGPADVLAVLADYVDGRIEGGGGAPARLLPSGEAAAALASRLWAVP